LTDAFVVLAHGVKRVRTAEAAWLGVCWLHRPAAQRDGSQ
jgi:hypothetical protein